MKQNEINKAWLNCDFHIHTHFSDGALSLKDTIDLYGKHGFDVIAITDHIVNEKELSTFRAPNGKYVGILLKDDFPRYIQSIKQEAIRAMKLYNMLVLPGAEFTNNLDGFHLVGLDVTTYLNPGEPIERIVEHIHQQDGLAIAAHPVRGYYDNNAGMTYLWENRHSLKNLIDAWELANRFDLYDEVAQSGLPIIGNSDFHEPSHLFSWKTLLGCSKSITDVKETIRDNTRVAIRFYEDEKLVPEIAK